MDSAVPELTQRLLERGWAPSRLPDALLREYADYPDSRKASRPGARLAPALLRGLEVSRP